MRASWSNLYYLIAYEFLLFRRHILAFIGVFLFAFLVPSMCYMLWPERSLTYWVLSGISFTFFAFYILFAYSFASDLRMEIESKRILPILSLPVERFEYLFAKWLTLMIISLSSLSVLYWGLVFTYKLAAEYDDFFEQPGKVYFAFLLISLTFFTSIFFLGILYLHPLINLIVHGVVYFTFNPAWLAFPVEGFSDVPQVLSVLGRIVVWIARILPTSPVYYVFYSYKGTWGIYPWIVLLIHNLTWVLALLYLSRWFFQRVSLTRAH